MEQAEQDSHILKLEDRVKEIDSDLSTAKVWLKVLGTLAAALGLSAIAAFTYLRSQYSAINDNAARIQNEFNGHLTALKDVDEWLVRHPDQDSEKQLDGLRTRINNFPSKLNPRYTSDVLDLRNFALNYFDIVSEHPDADKDGTLVVAIQNAVDIAINRGDFSHDDAAARKWHQSTAPKDFKDFLSKFQEDRGVHDAQLMSCYQSLFSFWYTSLSTGPSTVSSTCLNAGVNPYE